MKYIKIFLSTCLATACFSIHTAFAQKGGIMLYGSVNYHETTVGHQFGAAPVGIGYFFNDNMNVGVNYGFNTAYNKALDFTDHTHELGPFYSNTWPLGEHFMLIGQVDAHYLWGDQHVVGQEGPVDGKYNGFLFRVYPLVGINLGKGWALKAKVAELSYKKIHGKDAVLADDHEVITGINGSTVGLGLSKNLFF
ncbi:hypothetical protein ACR78Z_02815 [Sphingobacterium thalpophilum]|uniref:hypothetical protein n=1 Tax=Sphingobacterium thalpophilum TaxID=259 RepID=UPI002D78697B|nr:hypothetical protein [Sphingobacterium thalpophilum]